jgi:hypothetical protein
MAKATRPVVEGTSGETEVSDAEFLNWIADRLIHVHGEPENVDFLLRLRCMADDLELLYSAAANMFDAEKELESSKNKFRGRLGFQVGRNGYFKKSAPSPSPSQPKEQT